MITPTHILLSCGLLTRKNSPARNWAVFVGGVAPDLTMFGMFAWDRFVLRLPEATIWDQRYFSDAWQIPTAIGHSIPLFGLLLAIGLALRWEVITALCLSVMLHIAGDLPTHFDDGHMHFWPLSRWVYASPVSYYDPRHYGNIMHFVELGIMVAMCALLCRRFSARWVRVVAGAGIVTAIAVPVYFSLVLGGQP
jgi:hypothetical protein